MVVLVWNRKGLARLLEARQNTTANGKKLHLSVSAASRIVRIIQTSGSGSVVTWHQFESSDSSGHGGTSGSTCGGICFYTF